MGNNILRLSCITNTQLGRHNLSPVQRIDVIEMYSPIYEKQAKKNLTTSTGGHNLYSLLNLINTEDKTDTTKKYSYIVGVSEKIYCMGAKDCDMHNKDLNKRVQYGGVSM